MIKDFESETFNAKSYANKILSESTASNGLLELEENICNLNLKIQEIILNSQGELISNSSFNSLEKSTLEYNSQLQGINKKFQGIKEKSLFLWQEMANKSLELESEIEKSKISKALIRFLNLYKRLENSESNSEPNSGILHDLNAIIKEYDLERIEIVQEKVQVIKEYQEKTNDFAKSRLENALEISNLQDIILGLGMFYNLETLDTKVLENLDCILKNISNHVENGLNSENFGKIMKSAVKRVHEPTISDANSRNWIKELWENVEKMTEGIYKECVKVLRFF